MQSVKGLTKIFLKKSGFFVKKASFFLFFLYFSLSRAKTRLLVDIFRRRFIPAPCILIIFILLPKAKIPPSHPRQTQKPPKRHFQKINRRAISPVGCLFLSYIVYRFYFQIRCFTGNDFQGSRALLHIKEVIRQHQLVLLIINIDVFRKRGCRNRYLVPVYL